MTKRKSAAPRRALPVAVAALAAIGIGCTSVAGARDAEAPVACALKTTKGPHGLTFEGIVEARSDVRGDYDLRIEKSDRSGSATIRQSGEFRLNAGATETLGEATLGGRRKDFDVSLTLTIGGKRYRCGDTMQPQDT